MELGQAQDDGPIRDGTLVARGPRKTVVIADADCRANVLYADPQSGRVAFVCRAREFTGSGGTVWAPLSFFVDGRVVASGVEVTPSSQDEFDTEFRIWRARGDRSYDLGTGEFVASATSAAEADDTPLGGSATRSLWVPRKGKPYVRDQTDGTRTEIDVRLLVDHDAYWSQGRVTGNMLMAAADETRVAVIDLAAAKALGVVTGPALALDAKGLVLVAAAADGGLLVGPLRWVAPRLDRAP